MHRRSLLLVLLPPLAIALACGDQGDPVESSEDGYYSDASSWADAHKYDSGDARTDSATLDSATHDGASEVGPNNVVALAPLTIFTVLFENHDYYEIVGSKNAPYFNYLIGKYGLATNYSDCGIHPSLPNYLCMVSGAPQYPGYVDLSPTQSFITGSFPVAKENLGSQLEKAKIPWGSYQESMGAPCTLHSQGLYAPKHDPFLYFDDMQNGANDLCERTNVDYSHFAADLAANKNRYYFITPNLVHDGHDPSKDPVLGLQTSDAWAMSEIPKIMASAAYKNNGVIFITWDEAEGRSGRSEDQVPMIVVSERIKFPGYATSAPLSHKSYLATVEDLLGLPRLPTVKYESTLGGFLK